MEKKNLGLQERVDLYNASWGKKYPGSYLLCQGKMFSGVFLLGNNYKGSGYYGSYPPAYLKRLETLFPDCKKVLHLFSGSLPKSKLYTRVDMEVKDTDIRANAQELSQHLQNNHWDLVYADPPYSPADAVRYGTPMPNRKKVLEECSKVLKPGGFVVWLDTVWPMIAKKHLVLVGVIGILRSQNHRVRFCFIMKKPGE